jgi:alpha-tubulin suppressor-like RCC1 family protein
MRCVAGTQSFGVGLRKDGTVVYCGEPVDGADNVDLWQNIVQIDCAGDVFGKKYHVVGLRNDGTVVAEGYNKFGQCNVSDWRNIVQIVCGENCTYGLKADGTVVFTGEGKFGCGLVKSFTDVVRLAYGNGIVLGLRKDGTVEHAGYNAGQAKEWTGIIHVAAGLNHCVGIRGDGSVVAVGDNSHGQCNVGGWYDIMSIACGYNSTVAVRTDGTVLYCGSDGAEFADIRNAMAVKAEKSGFYVLCADGSIERTTFGSWDCYENAWEALQYKPMEIPTDPEAKKVISDRVQFQRRNKNAGRCRYCGGNFKGLFDKKCPNCGIDKDY